MIIQPGWVEIIQLLIRIVLILLCTTMVGLAFKGESTNSPNNFIIIIGLGSGLIILATDPAYSSFSPFLEIIFLLSLIIGISILAATVILKSEFLRNGYKASAAIWIAGVLGIIIGKGLYLAAIIIAVLSFFILIKFNSDIKVK